MLRSAWVVVLFLLVAGLVLLAAQVSAQSLQEWVVTSSADSGQGTLRWAIDGANDSPGDDVIRFSGAMTIRPRSALPALSGENISIDGSSGDVSPDVAPRIWIDGARAGDAAGVEIVAAGSLVCGIGVFGFERYGIGVIGVDASQVTIDGNWIGLRPDGTASANRLSGVAVIGGASGVRVSNNRIAGNSVQERTGHGIVIGGGGSVGAVVSGNVIGIGHDGSMLPNDDGILVVDSAQATIRDNTIGNSSVAGIELRETRLQIEVDANRIGIRRDGALAPNDVGLFLGPGSAQARVGSREANVIAGNRVGIAVEQGAREALIENNWIGLAPRALSGRPAASSLPDAAVRPNLRRGISVILGAAEIQLRGNYVAAGDFGVVVDDVNTTQVNLTSNVVAGSRQGRTVAAIDVRAGTEITIGGDAGFGNHVCGAEFGIRLANTEEPRVHSNAVGASVATRVTFDSDHRLTWAIRLDDGVVRAQVSGNEISDSSRAGISIVGSSSQDNELIGAVSSQTSLGPNQFSGNSLDIDLGADGPTENDLRDRDDGPNRLLNHPVLVEHTLRRISASNYRSTFSGTASPGSRVYIFARNALGEHQIARSKPANSAGNWEALTAVIPSGAVRALAVSTAGATSELSPAFLPSQRVKLVGGVNWFAWTGPAMGIEEAMSPLLRRLETVWVWKSAEERWVGWSPLVSSAPSDRHGGLQTLETGDVVRMQLSSRASGDFFVPSGGAIERPTVPALKQGFNSVTWLGRGVDSLDALAEIDEAQSGLIGNVWQWDGDSWALIWPRLRRAWDPGWWAFPALWIRAIRDGELTLP
ncbi:MAG: right-handed parallel beta-helix repeat-containing protein [Chloroflexota bacterium]|nr:right-handed parallel beta-helix repeat-containing protein [Chloroflexota bacterium]